MKILVFADSRGQYRPAGSTHQMFSERLGGLPGLQVDNFLCPFKWTTTLDFLAYFPLDQLRGYDYVVVYTGIVDWSPRKLSNARDDLYDNRNEANLDALLLNTADYSKKIVNCKKPTFDRIFGDDAMHRHLASPFDTVFEGEPTINMYGLEMAQARLLPRLLEVPNLVFINANRFVDGWRGDYRRERPANIYLTHAYSDLFSQALGDCVIDLRVWDDNDVKRFTCDNLHLTGAGSDFIYDQLAKKFGFHAPRRSTAMQTPSPTTPDVLQAASFTELLAANRALREGDNDRAYAKAKKLFDHSGRASHFHTALLAATRAGKTSQMEDLFAAAGRLGRADVDPKSAESDYLRR